MRSRIPTAACDASLLVKAVAGKVCSRKLCSRRNRSSTAFVARRLPCPGLPVSLNLCIASDTVLLGIPSKLAIYRMLCPSLWSNSLSGFFGTYSTTERLAFTTILCFEQPKKHTRNSCQNELEGFVKQVKRCPFKAT
jgi:hypothetical protein